MSPFGIGWVIAASIVSAFVALLVFGRFPGRTWAAILISLAGSVPTYLISSGRNEIRILMAIAASWLLLFLWGFFGGRRLHV